MTDPVITAEVVSEEEWAKIEAKKRQDDLVTEAAKVADGIRSVQGLNVIVHCELARMDQRAETIFLTTADTTVKMAEDLLRGPPAVKQTAEAGIRDAHQLLLAKLDALTGKKNP